MFCNFCLFPKLHTKTKICLQSAGIVSHRSQSPNHCYGWNNHPNNKLLVPSPHSLDIIHVWPSVIDILNLCLWQSLTIYVRYGYCFTCSNNHQTPPICFKCESSTSRLHTHTHTHTRAPTNRTFGSVFHHSHSIEWKKGCSSNRRTMGDRLELFGCIRVSFIPAREWKENTNIIEWNHSINRWYSQVQEEYCNHSTENWVKTEGPGRNEENG